MGQKIIEVSGLCRSFGKIRAVRGIDFTVEQGSLFAFLGVNGAGKSTTIDILCTLLKPDEGTAAIGGYALGKEDKRIRDIIGIVFQDSLLDSNLTVAENLGVRAGLYGLKGTQLKDAVKQAAKITELADLLDRPYGKLSGGQRRRADIARALIHMPKILFLDEPTTGLDPKTRKNIWETIQKLQREQGMTVFLTTHYMEEAARADFVTVMGHGEILAKGTPVDLKQRYASDLLRIKPKNRDVLSAYLRNHGIEFQSAGEALCIRLQSTLDAIDMILPCRGEISNFEVLNGTMDDAFLNITGEEGQELC